MHVMGLGCVGDNRKKKTENYMGQKLLPQDKYSNMFY